MQMEKMMKLHYAETLRALGLATPMGTVATSNTVEKDVRKSVVIRADLVPQVRKVCLVAAGSQN